MTEAPDVYPDFPDDEEPGESVETDVEGALDPGTSDPQVRTGQAPVDAVLDSLDELDQLPVAEHAAVFGRAHDQLRAALEPDRESA